jgi:hypothetical protein
MVDPLSMKVFWSLKLFISLVGSLFGSNMHIYQVLDSKIVFEWI